LAELPALATCVAAARRLNHVLRRKSQESLDAVLKPASTALKDFAANLRRDLGAVQAALDLPWTTSPAEGQINRLKMLKRSIC
jgi:transposase